MISQDEINQYIALRNSINEVLGDICPYYNTERKKRELENSDDHMWVYDPDRWCIEGDYIVSPWTLYGSLGYPEEMTSYIPFKALTDENYISEILDKQVQQKKEIAEMNLRFAEERKLKELQDKLDQYNKLKEELGL